MYSSIRNMKKSIRILRQNSKKIVKFLKRIFQKCIGNSYHHNFSKCKFFIFNISIDFLQNYIQNDKVHFSFSVIKKARTKQKFQVLLLKLVNLLFMNVHHLKILQFQTVLLKLMIMLLVDVHHLQILQFQIVLQKLVHMLLVDAHHLQIL